MLHPHVNTSELSWTIWSGPVFKVTSIVIIIIFIFAPGLQFHIQQAASWILKRFSVVYLKDLYLLSDTRPSCFARCKKKARHIDGRERVSHLFAGVNEVANQRC